MVELVIDYIKKAIKEHPIKTDKDTYFPEVLYMNGNDSTDFDWEINDRTCELEVLYSDQELVYIRVFITRKGFIQGWVWDTLENESRKPLEPLEIGERKATIIKNELRVFDNLGLWDKPIHDLSHFKHKGV